MTNREVLNANLLDIIFENRNKDYGAYELRKGYEKRLLIALGAGLLFILLFIVINAAGSKKQNIAVTPQEKEPVVIRTIVMPKEDIKLPEKPKEPIKQKPVQKVASVKYTAPVIKKDIEVKDPIVATKELDGKEIATKTTDGKEADDKVVINKEPVEDPGTGNTTSTGPSQPEFVANEKDPEFPGGQAALSAFLSRNLNTPQDLSAGEKKVVRIRFKVDKDGTVNTFEIVTSGGDEFDREVLRVAKKMPRWKPAVQNGINVPVNYMLPVTFIGIE